MHYYELPAHTPALSLLLDPRSLVITTREQYSERAHGIDPVAEDRVGELELANGGMLGSSGSGGCGAGAGAGRCLLGNGGVLQRQTRYSLTCRDVARVMNVGVGTTRKS